MRRSGVLVAAVLVTACGKGDGGDDTGPVGDEGLPTVFINEFLASNQTGLQDESGAYPDWIELYNPGNRDADIGGWWMTDNLDNALKWQIPSGVTVPAGGYLIIFADGDTDEGPHHASFALDRLGEDIGLFGPNSLDNPLVDSVEAYGPQAVDQSMGRIPDGSANWDFMYPPTPEAPNGG